MPASAAKQREVYEKLIAELTEKRARIEPTAAAKSPAVAAALAETDRLIAKYTAKLAALPAHPR